MRKTIWIAPIMPIKCRYSEWWNRLFRDELKKRLNVCPMTSDIYDVQLLANPLGMNVYLSFNNTTDFFIAQTTFEVDHSLTYLSEKILQVSNHDTILVLDAVTPGLVASYLQTYKPCKVVGICHATGLNNRDIFDKHRNRVAFDMANLRIFDELVVASDYHRQKLVSGLIDEEEDNCEDSYAWVKSLGALPDNPILSQLDVLRKGVNIQHKGGCVVDRRGSQKRNDEVLAFLKQFGKPVTDIHGACDNFRDFYETLVKFRYMVVTAQEETYGYQVQEAMRLGVIPLCPNRLCYPQFVPARYLYEDKYHLLRLVAEIEDQPESPHCQIIPLNVDAKVRFWDNLIALFH